MTMVEPNRGALIGVIKEMAKVYVWMSCAIMRALFKVKAEK